MMLYEEPVHFCKPSTPFDWEEDLNSTTLDGVLLWVKHYERVLRSVKGIPLPTDEQHILGHFLCVVKDLEDVILSSLQKKLDLLYGDWHYSKYKKDMLEARYELQRAMVDLFLSNSTTDSLTPIEIPNISPLELRVKLLCRQNSFASQYTPPCLPF